MFSQTNYSTLAAINKQIQMLEFAFMQIYPTIDEQSKNQLQEELALAYNFKMQIFKLRYHDYKNYFSKNSKTYPSKVNQKTYPFDNRRTTCICAQNMEMPQLRSYYR